MYLSLLKLDLQGTKTKRDIANPYDLHRTLCMCFPNLGKVQERILFRLDVLDDQFDVLVQSLTKPDWDRNRNGNYTTEIYGPKLIGPLNLHIGDRLKFRLRANTVRGCGGRNPKPIYKKEEQKDWLIWNAKHCGFSVEKNYIDVVKSWKQQVFRKGIDSESGFTGFAAADFEGVLTVTDAELLAKSVAYGIGRARHCGFGLLSLARCIDVIEVTQKRNLA